MPAERNGDHPVASALILNSPVARAFTLVGDRWVGLILRDVFLGIRRFEQFRRRSGAARGTLTSRLRTMVDNDLLYRRQYQESPARFEYRLTPKGLALYPFILAVWSWETAWSVETRIPPDLEHTACGHRARPVFRCRKCRETLHMRDVQYSVGRGSGPAATVPARFQRRSRQAEISDDDVDRRFFHVLDIIGDRWTGLVVAAMYFGLNRYDEIAAALGIATNILADRLKRLVSAGILERVPYQERPLRYRYRMTEKGTALYPIALALHEWATRWLFEGEKPSLLLKHMPCNSRLHPEVACSHCGGELTASNVTFDRSFLENDR